MHAARPSPSGRPWLCHGEPAQASSASLRRSEHQRAHRLIGPHCRRAPQSKITNSSSSMRTAQTCCGERPDERLTDSGVAVFALERSLLRVRILARGRSPRPSRQWERGAPVPARTGNVASIMMPQPSRRLVRIQRTHQAARKTLPSTTPTVDISFFYVDPAAVYNALVSEVLSRASTVKFSIAVCSLNRLAP